MKAEMQRVHANPDQSATLEAVRSGSALFAQA